MGTPAGGGKILPIKQDTLPQTEAQSELSIKCRECGEPLPVNDEGVCGACEWTRRREALIKQRQTEENERRRREMIETLGEGSVSRFTFEKFDAHDSTAKKAVEFCKKFEPSIHNLYLTGITGSGKTHLACAVAMKMFEAGKMVRFFASGPELSREFRGLEADEERKRIKFLSDVDVLIINELGIGRDTEFSIQITTEVIDRRIMRGKNGLIVTSNFHPADLAVKMNDSRLESRFTGLCKIIETGKTDYRKKFRQA